MTNHTKIGTCPHCGAPVWARKRADGDNAAMDYSPPKAEYSCDCRLAAMPVPTVPAYPTYPWWQQWYYEGPWPTKSPGWPWYPELTTPITYTTAVTGGATYGTPGDKITFDGTVFGTPAIYASN